MYQNGKKILAMLLALCMVVGVLPLTAQAALLEGEDYITQQLYLGEDLVLHLRGDVPEAYRNSSAIVTFRGESTTYTINDMTQDENGLYDMPITVNVAEMTEDIDLVLKYMGLNAIEETYSVADYLKTLIGGNYTYETQFLALELLNFGAAAQTYFDHNTDNLANAGYEFTPANAVPESVPGVDVTGGVEGIRFYGTSVRFLSQTAVRFYFVADSVTGLTFTVDGTEYAAESNENGYFIEVGGINPQDMETELNVSVTNGEDTLSVKYAPIDYFIRTYHKTENEAMKNLAAAAYSYFVAAKNFVGVTPTGDFTEGVEFDNPGNAQMFSGVGGDNAWRDALLQIVSFEDNNVLMLTCTSSPWPVFRINFGKTLKAGTVLTFDAYTDDLSGIRDTVSVFEYVSGGDATVEYPHGTWKNLNITLTNDCDHIDLVCTMDRRNENVDPSNIQVYMDNFLAIEPVEPEGDFLEGVGFEIEGNRALFVGQGVDQDATIRRIAYAKAGVSAPANGGEYALKVSHASHCWPTFRINFGKTLKAGTTITFDLYGNYDYEAATGVNKYMKLELTGDSKKYATSADPSQVVWTLVETWKTATVTLTAETDHIDFMYNVADGSHGNVSSWMLLDNVLAVEPLAFTGDFETGVGFEDKGDVVPFTGAESGQDATIERASYADAGVSAPANGDEYALKVSHASHCWPTFRINFGKTLKAGTTITFDLYGNYDYEAATGVNKYMKLELTGDSKKYATSADPSQVVWTLVETWKTATVTLTAETDHIDFMYNVADGQHGNVSSWLLLDNVLAVEPLVFSGDFETGVGFEDKGDIVQFAGLTDGVQFEIVSFEDDNVLKASHASHCWPNFRVNFGKTLKAGTTITFDFYGNYDYEAAMGVTKYVKLELTGDSKNYATSEDPNQVVWTVVETWKTATITLTADSDHVDFFYNVADGQHGDVASWIYLDNFTAVEPVVITEGLSFDKAAEASVFTGLTDGVTLEIVSFEDNNVMKVSHANNCWPNFRINFGETLPAGTVITFDVYGNYDYVVSEGGYKYVKLEMTGDSKNYATSEDPNQIVWTLTETWNTGLTITLTADCDHIDLFYNVADGQHGDVASWIYLDNFTAVEPVVISEGLSFDKAAEASVFTGLTDGVTLEIVSFEDNNVMKVSHANNCWPNFRINFGETLPAGTVITFDVYGNYDYVVSEGGYKYVKLEMTGDSKNYATSEDPNQIVWTLTETWNTGLTITLTADCDHIDLFYNVADGQHGDVASWIYLDNFKVE